MDNRQIEITRQLMYRLERLSVDSHWARRASGLRGSLLKCLEQAEMGESLDPEEEKAWLKRLDELTGKPSGSWRMQHGRSRPGKNKRKRPIQWVAFLHRQVNPYLRLRYSSMAAAERLPAATASTTRAGPVVSSRRRIHLGER